MFTQTMTRLAGLQMGAAALPTSEALPGPEQECHRERHVPERHGGYQRPEAESISQRLHARPVRRFSSDDAEAQEIVNRTHRTGQCIDVLWRPMTVVRYGV